MPGLAIRVLKGHRRMVRAIIVYTGSLVALLFFYAHIDGTSLMEPLLRFNAQAAGFLAGAFGMSVQVSGSQVLSDTFAFRIVSECTSLAPFAIFAAAVIAYPSTHSRMILGIILGFFGLSAINLVRITSLIFIGTTFPDALDVAHILVWQSVMVIASVMFWMIWIPRNDTRTNT
jgi:exosortase/archaeosortase family protein